MRGVGHLVSVLCVTVGLLGPAWGHFIPTKRSGQAVPLLTYKVTRITKQLTDQGHRVQLFLEGSRLPSVHLTAYLDQPEQLPVRSDGSVEFYPPNDTVDISFLHPQGYGSLRFHLNQLSSSVSVPDVELFLQGGKEVTFEAGSDAKVNVTFTADNSERRVVYSGLRFSFVAKSNTEDHVLETFHEGSEAPFVVLEEGGSTSEKFMYIRLDTSSGDLEGLAQIEANVKFDFKSQHYSYSSFEYFIHEDVPVYRNDHDGPFPVNYIGLLDPNRPRDLCSLHKTFPCQLVCQFIGDHPTPVEFVHVAGQVSEPHLFAFSNNGFHAVGVLTLGDVTRAGEEVEYQCRSTSGSEVVSHTVKVMTVYEARIIDGPTKITRPDNVTVEATCVAVGTPAPTLSFYQSNGLPMNDVSSDSYEIVMTTPEESTSKAVLRINDPAVANSLDHVTCKAVNEIRGHSFSMSYVMYVPQEDSTLSPYAGY